MSVRALILTACLLTFSVVCIGQVSMIAREEYRTVNGVRLYTRTLGSGEPILVVHGGPGLDHSYFLPQLGDLARSHQLIFFDQRVHGRSSSPRDTAFIRMNNLVEDVEALRKVFRLGKMNLLAHSWGTLVALLYAARYPDNLKALILVSPVAANDSLRDLATRIQSRRITREDSLALAEVTGSLEFKRQSPAALDRYFRRIFRSTFHDPRYVDSLTLVFSSDYREKSEKLRHLWKDLGTFDYYPQLGLIKAPTLIIRGEGDPTPFEAAQRMLDLIPDASLEVLSGAGHFPFIENRSKFRAIVEDFLHSRI